MARRTSWKFWNKKRLQFRNKRSQEWNVISNATAASMECASPFDGCGIDLDYPDSTGLPCPETVQFTPIVLSAAVVGDLAGQPIWPNHTVDRIRGTIFVHNRGFATSGNTVKPGGTMFLHLGICVARWDFDGSPPAPDTDIDPGHEDDAEDRWIWTGHYLIPPSPGQPNAGGFYELDAPTGNNFVHATYDATNPSKVGHGISLLTKNKVVVKEGNVLVLISSVSHAPWPPSSADAFGGGEGGAGTMFLVPYIRTHVTIHK